MLFFIFDWLGELASQGNQEAFDYINKLQLN